MVVDFSSYYTLGFLRVLLKGYGSGASRKGEKKTEQRTDCNERKGKRVEWPVGNRWETV